jgi:hypothetical protein
VLDRVDERFRDPAGRWVGTSGRVRVIAYNTDALDPSELPDSVLDLTDPRWKGKVGVAPTNASFQAFVTAMRLEHGDERTRDWLEDMKANDVKLYEKNTPIVEAVASGEIDLGLVNHYYLYLVKEEQPAPWSTTTSCRARPRSAREAWPERERSREWGHGGRGAVRGVPPPTRGSASTRSRPRRPSTRSLEASRQGRPLAAVQPDRA